MIWYHQVSNKFWYYIIVTWFWGKTLEYILLEVNYLLNDSWGLRSSILLTSISICCYFCSRWHEGEKSLWVCIEHVQKFSWRNRWAAGIRRSIAKNFRITFVFDIHSGSIVAEHYATGLISLPELITWNIFIFLWYQYSGMMKSLHLSLNIAHSSCRLSVIL